MCVCACACACVCICVCVHACMQMCAGACLHIQKIETTLLEVGLSDDVIHVIADDVKVTCC